MHVCGHLWSSYDCARVRKGSKQIRKQAGKQANRASGLDTYHSLVDELLNRHELFFDGRSVLMLVTCCVNQLRIASLKPAVVARATRRVGTAGGGIEAATETEGV